MIKILIIFYIFLLSGCARIEKLERTRFEIIPSNNKLEQFKFMVRTGISNSYESNDGEMKRMEWLNMWLSDNSMCKNGYFILNKNAVYLGKYDDVYDIYYVGQCK